MTDYHSNTEATEANGTEQNPIEKAAQAIDKRIAELLRIEQSPRPPYGGNSTDTISEENLPPAKAGAPSIAPRAKVNKKMVVANQLAILMALFIERISEDTSISILNFGKRLIASLGLREQNQKSKYISFLSNDDVTITLRIADHSGNARNVILRGVKTDRGISLVLRDESSPVRVFKPGKRFSVKEYIYENPDHPRLVKISKSIFGLFDMGQYYDLANADVINESPKA